MPRVWKTHVDTTEYSEPMDLAVVSGDPNLRIHALRDTHENGERVLAGIACVEPSVYRYELEADEVLYLMAGEIDVRIEPSGELVTIRPGDMVSFERGTVATWTIKEPVKELFVMSGRDDAGAA